MDHQDLRELPEALDRSAFLELRAAMAFLVHLDLPDQPSPDLLVLLVFRVAWVFLVTRVPLVPLVPRDLLARCLMLCSWWRQLLGQRRPI